MGYNWPDPSGWGESGPTLQLKAITKRGKKSPMRPNLKVDPGGNAFEDSEWALKLNEGSVVETMPLLSEFLVIAIGGPNRRDGPGCCIIAP